MGRHPFLGLDVITKEGMIIYLHGDMRSHPHGQWKLPLYRQGWHLFFTWDPSEILCTRAELHEMHLSFFHPSSLKIYNLNHCAISSDTTPQTLKTLDRIRNTCSKCTEYKVRCLPFRVTMPTERLAFNQDPRWT